MRGTGPARAGPRKDALHVGAGELIGAQRRRLEPVLEFDAQALHRIRVGAAGHQDRFGANEHEPEKGRFRVTRLQVLNTLKRELAAATG